MSSFAAPRNSIPNLPACDAVQKIYRREPVPEAGEGLDMGGKCYVKTLLEHVTGVEDCHFPGSPETNFMKGRYGSMTPGFEIALMIGLVIGFALGYGVRALISYRRHQAARRRRLF